MPSEIQAFSYDERPVRTIERSGATWFFAADVCDALGIKNSRDAIGKLDYDEKDVANADTLGGKQEVSVISEAGVYRLVFQSRKPVAEKFKRWLVHEVIPAIRRTGRYEARPIAPAPAFPITDRQARRIRFAKLGLVGAAMRLEELGINAAAIDMGAVVAFGRQLARI